MMRLTIQAGVASLLLTGAAVACVTPALAGADDGDTKAFWGSQAAPVQQAPVQQGTADRNSQYRASYNQYIAEDPADTKVNPNASSGAEENDIYFYHSMGTMSRP